MEKVYNVAIRVCAGISFGFSIISLLNQDNETALMCLSLSALLYIMYVVRRVINNV